MATIKIEINVPVNQFQRLLKSYPDINGRYLAYLGKRGREIIKKEFVSGQIITLRKYPQDKRGRWTISSNVDKRRRFTKIASYPLNFYPRRIITGDLKRLIMANMGRYAVDFERRVVNDELRKLGL